MHTCIPSHGLKRSRHSCPSRVNSGDKNTPSMQHPGRRNVATSMVGLNKKKKPSHMRRNLTPNGEAQRYSWEGTRRRMVKPRDTLGRQKKKNGEAQRYSWEGRRRRMVKPRDTAGKAEEEEW